MHPVLTAFAEDAVAAHSSATDSTWELAWTLQEIQPRTTDHDLCLSCIYSQPFLLHCFFPCQEPSDTFLLKKSSYPEPIDRWPWNLVCSIVHGSSTKVVQIMTLGWPWPILRQGQICHIGFCMGKTENYLFFGNYCSLGSQSCLKRLAKWVNEVEWVSKVKVILWPWSKVTQISKFKTCFSRKQYGNLEPKFIWKLEGE